MNLSSLRAMWLLGGAAILIGACVFDREGRGPANTTGGNGGGGPTPTTATSVGGGGSPTTGNAVGGSTGCSGPEDCASATCVDPDAGQFMPAETCDGDVCFTEIAVTCAGGFKCEGDACLTTCNKDDACVVTHYCNTSTSQCEPKLSDGEDCDDANACGSGFCVDDVCCDIACAGTCMACDQASTGVADGTCAPIPAWDDPLGECTALDELACNGDGGCATCGDDIAAPGDGVTPLICDSVNIITHTCTIDVDTANEFDGIALDCPANWHCVVNCVGASSCRNTTITCPTDYSCTIDCPSNDICRDSTIVCPDNGTCDITCGDDGCEDGTVQCGNNSCAVDCVAGENKPPIINNGNSCLVDEDC